ncbi:odorant receptor 30a-like [Anticarsia gemmatalis]|uniref:odorant receptor 30a-like n=1 Tax=Anticarsia gemmatalis TaxID=129554 RepID=UPI003F75A5B8
MELHQGDCFKINMKIWYYLGIWPGHNPNRYYNYYSKLFLTFFVFIYDGLSTINFYFLPRKLDIFIEELLLYFTELSVLSKILTFLFMHDKIIELFKMLESDIFQPDDEEGIAIVKEAKNFNVKYWKIVATASYTSNISHVSSPLLFHFITSAELFLPVSSYLFLSDEFRDAYIYPLFIYQGLGIHFIMLYNVYVDTFILGLMNYVIAQLDILDVKLRRVTDVSEAGETSKGSFDNSAEAIRKINQCIVHYGEVDKFCNLIQDVFSLCLFAQFGFASCVICVCLFRYTLGAPVQYYVFLSTYIFVMVIQILIPCWYGTKIMDKSTLLSFATYNCDWTSRSRQFKSNLRLFVERANKPLSITGGKMFCLSLITFTSIMNSAYSFFTLLQHMQTRE